MSLPKSVQAVFGTEEHQNLLKKVIASPHTNFCEKWNIYQTLWFFVNDNDFDYGDLTDKCLQVFMDRVRIACATYLERQQQGLTTTN